MAIQLTIMVGCRIIEFIISRLTLLIIMDNCIQTMDLKLIKSRWKVKKLKEKLKCKPKQKKNGIFLYFKDNLTISLPLFFHRCNQKRNTF